MTREELERRLDEAEKQNLGLLDEIKNLKAKLADMQDEPEIPDMPDFKNREELFFAGGDLENVFNRFMNTNISVSDFNAFHTKAYAEEFRKKCLMIAMMLHCKWYVERDYVPDWYDGDRQKWTIVYNYKEEKFTVEFSRMREWSAIYFDTQANAQKCADWMNEHWKEEEDGKTN